MECEETEPQENMETLVENMENFRNNEQFIIETKHSYPKRNSNSEFSHGGNMNIIIENLDPSRLPAIIIENESKNLSNTIKFNDNPSVCENGTSSGVTRGQGVVICVLARAFVRDRIQMVKDSDT